MKEREVLKLIKGGENSYVEFKEDKVDNLKLVKELVAMTNHRGGIVLLGVDDDGVVKGLSRDDNEERVMNICSDIVKPSILPTYYEVKIRGKKIGVIELGTGVSKPYYIQNKVTLEGRQKTVKTYYIRRGSSSREVISDDELKRLYQASKSLHYEIMPVERAGLHDMDEGKIREYLATYRPSIELKEDSRSILYENLDIACFHNGAYKPTVAGLLLFGASGLKRFLPMTGIMCVKVAGNNITDEKQNLKFFERTIFDNYNDALSFFYIYNAHSFVIKGSKRVNFYDYPEAAFRELLANALIHRDYAISGTDIGVWIFDDRIEIKSPGGLPNTLTVEKMKMGMKYHRNPVLAQYFFDADMVERAGQGIVKCNRLLKENGNPELDIKEDEHEVVVTMYKREQKK